MRLRTESDIATATLVVSRGREATGLEMTKWGDDGSNRYWEAEIAPETQTIRYSFALRTVDGQAVYLTRTGVSNAVERLDRWEVDLGTLRVFDVPEWARGAVIYQIFPDRFANGDPGNDPEGVVPWDEPPHWLRFQGGDLDGVVQHLDHLDRLGVDVVYLNPIFVSPSTHGYDTVDYRNVDDRFGGNEALRRLVAAVHERGMRIILDVSFNHVHPRFFAFADVVENGAGFPVQRLVRRRRASSPDPPPPPPHRAPQPRPGGVPGVRLPAGRTDRHPGGGGRRRRPALRADIRGVVRGGHDAPARRVASRCPQLCARGGHLVARGIRHRRVADGRRPLRGRRPLAGVAPSGACRSAPTPTSSARSWVTPADGWRVTPSTAP